jgi:hypothetical protein
MIPEARVGGRGLDHFIPWSLYGRIEVNLVYSIEDKPIGSWQLFQAAQATMAFPVNGVACNILKKKNGGIARP